VGLVDVFLEHILRFIIYSFRSVVHSMKAAGTGKWSFAEATVTAQPTVLRGFGRPVVEVVYSYRSEGEVYTGLHEEPFLRQESLANYVVRFSEGRKFVVRFKPEQPETSVIRRQDQLMQFAHS
jgi:hypothetical protein